VPHRGELHLLGTRYHYDDLYGHLQKNDLKDSHQVIPALNENELSPWPEKFPPKWFFKKRERAGTIIFNAQYQCDTAAMQGEVFQYDHCQIVDDSQIPEDLRMFIGVDLAIGEKEKNDLFALIVLGLCKQNNRYVVDYFDGHLRFSEQTRTILKYYRRYDPVRCCIETNAYQAAQYQTLKDEDKDLRLVPVNQHKDKITRAWKLSALFEEGKFHFRRGLQGRLLDQLILFPNYRYKDGFDALDLANQAIRMRKKKRRRRGDEPGLL
jgi:predicted phage terminase large subunit-like protein